MSAGSSSSTLMVIVLDGHLMCPILSGYSLICRTMSMCRGVRMRDGCPRARLPGANLDNQGLIIKRISLVNRSFRGLSSRTHCLLGRRLLESDVHSDVWRWDSGRRKKVAMRTHSTPGYFSQRDDRTASQCSRGVCTDLGALMFVVCSIKPMLMRRVVGDGEYKNVVRNCWMRTNRWSHRQPRQRWQCHDRIPRRKRMFRGGCFSVGLCFVWMG